MKQFLRYTLTIVAILIATTNVWAAATCHTVTKSTFETDESYQTGNWIKTTYYYYSQPQQQFLQITDNSYSTLSIVSFTVTGDKESGAQKFKILYSTGSGWQYYSTTEYSLERGSLLQGYPAGTTQITLSDAKIKSATAFGIEFTNYNANGSGNKSNKRTITISNVSVTFSPYFQSEANNTTLEAFPPTEKGTTCSTTRSFTYKYNNTVTSVNWESSNPMFTVSSTHIDDCSGEKVVTITFKPTEIRSEITGTITGTDNNGNNIVVYVKGSSWGKEDPTYTWKPEIWNGTSQVRTIYVGETINDMLSYTSSPANCTYTIEKLEDYGINNGDATTTFTNNTIVAGRAGKYKLTVSQPAHSISETSGYNAGETTITLDVVKYTTDFSLNFANEYYVDDEINKSTFLTKATNSEVAIQVSDKTADSRALFTYNGSILKANGATLNADAETTTITIQQTENYKWTGKSLTKDVVVRKHPTEFSWLLADTYYVGDVIIDIFTKNNNLPTTITSSDPNIVKVEGNQLVALNAGKAAITISQATDRKWVAFTQTKEITVLKHDIVATINPNTAYWNELVSNPFSATSTHPVSGQVTPIDQFNVEQQDNEHIALMDATTRDIQTYYTNGQVNFLITRDEDYKYNALSQTLTLTVNANENGCTLLSDPTHYKIGMYENSNGVDFTLPGIGDVLTFQLWKNTAATQDVHVYGYNAAGTQVLDKKYENSSITTNEDNPNNCSVQLSEDIVKIKIQAGGTLNKHFKNLNITRAQYLRPTDGERALNSTNTLKLPTVAFGKPSSNTFTLDWSTCSDIKIESSNSKFTIGTTPGNASKVFNLPDADGNQTFTVYCNTSEIGIYTGTITIYNQSRKVSFNVTDTVNDKWTPVMTGEESYSKKVGNTWTTNFTFKNTETATPSADKSAPFYFEIDHKSFVNTDRLTRNPNHLDEVISYNPDTYEITAHNAGTAVLTFVQQGNDGYYYSSRSCTITIDKNTPTFTWKDPIYFNQTISDYFTTNNNPNESEHATDIVISQESTDPDVAIIYFNQEDETDKHTLDLTTYYKETTPASSTTVTVSQAENWYWYAKEDTHTITPQNRNNQVEFTLTQENYIRDFQVEYVDPAANNKTPMGPDWQDGGIYFGGEGALDGNEGWNWDEKYIIIKFSGIPDTLTFDASRSDAATRTIKLSVSEGTSKDNLTEIWSNSTNSTNNGIECKLNPGTRFLKFSYTGNLWGLFKNINVTELNQFDAVPNSLDFGTVSVTDNTSKSLTFNIAYANAGYKVNIELDREAGRTWADEEAYNLAKQYIEITPDFIGTIGGEKSGTSEAITVRLHSDDQSGYTIPDDARIKIYDEVGHTTYVSLKGLIEKSTQSITWNAYFSLTEPIQIPLSTDWVFKAASASSNLPVKYKSSDTEVIEVSDDGLSFKPKNEGNATITAYQDGNSQYGYVESTKNVQVTKKNIQLIGWTDDLSDIIFEENTPDITLNAGVYIIDVVNNTFEYSADQTAKLVYTIGEGGNSVVTVEGNTLHIIGLGETTLTATIEADEFHEGTTMTIPVVVREPAIGCEDILLLDHPAQIEFFQMNTNQITKDAIALDRTKGIPGYLLFKHSGERWTLFYTGPIKAQQSTDGGNNWTDVPGSTITPTIGSFITTDSLPLDQNATHIRFVRPSGGQGHHFVKDIKVAPAQYLKANTTSIDFESINMGGSYTKTFTLSYSNIKSPLIATSSSKDVTVTPNRLGECGQFGEQEITVTWKPNNNQNQSVTFQDTLADLSVTVNLMANIQLRKQKIVWENRKSVIWDYTDIDNRPTHTRDVNNNELIDLPITYEVTEGTDRAYFEDNMFFIINEGNITIKASNPGNEEYLAVDSTYQITIQGIPPTFIGGAENDLWSTDANWVNGAKPDETQTASITAPVTIQDEKINVNKVRVASAGSIHITSTGGLTIGEGGIQTVTTDGSAIVIDNLHSGAGFFRISPDCEDELPRITMRYQTNSTLDNGANKNAEWQYIGAPGEDASVHVDYNTWLYRLDESQADWVLMPQNNNHTLSPFQGYALTQYGQPTYEWNAQMTNRNCTIPLTYHFDGRKGQNLIANSYTAPIDVTQMIPEDFQMIDGQSEYYDITQTLYLYNSGSWNAWHTQDSLGTGISLDGNNTTPGQYYAIPVLAVAEGYIPEKPTIAPMQGIYVRVRAKKTGGDTHVGNIIFDYNRIVMGTDHDMNRPMRAPQTTDKNTSDDHFRRVRIVANSTNSGSDRLYIIQAHNTTRNYDNGYDAPNQATQGIVNIYTYESGGKMEVSCANNIDSTYIGFMAGEDRTYTLHFNTIVGETLCLQDLTNGEKINIVEGGTYTFEAEPQSTNNQRFLLLAPQGIKSDTDEIDSVNIWYSNRTLYITNAADNSTLQLYDVSGHQIFSTTIHHTPYTVDLTHLTEGVYMARVNNQVYKFVCK